MHLRHHALCVLFRRLRFRIEAGHEVMRRVRLLAFGRAVDVGDGAGHDAGAQVVAFLAPGFELVVGQPLGQLAAVQLVEERIYVQATYCQR